MILTLAASTVTLSELAKVDSETIGIHGVQRCEEFRASAYGCALCTPVCISITGLGFFIMVNAVSLNLFTSLVYCPS